MDETAHTPNANLNANKYVMASYPPLPSGILNMNEIEMKYDNIVSKLVLQYVILSSFYSSASLSFTHEGTLKLCHIKYLTAADVPIKLLFRFLKRPIFIKYSPSS